MLLGCVGGVLGISGMLLRIAAIEGGCEGKKWGDGAGSRAAGSIALGGIKREKVRFCHHQGTSKNPNFRPVPPVRIGVMVNSEAAHHN